MRIDCILRALRVRMPSGIPESLCCREWRNGTYVLVQEGLAGAPWFRIAEGMASQAQWRRLLDRSVAPMRRLPVPPRRLAPWTGPGAVAGAVGPRLGPS